MIYRATSGVEAPIFMALSGTDKSVPW